MSQLFGLFKSFSLLLVTDHCFDQYIYHGNIFDRECFLSSLSKSLGLGIILGSVLVKLPQIIKLKANKSAAGLNVPGVLCDLTAITVHMAYNYVNGFPFSAWGETLCLAVQTAIVAALVFNYNSGQGKAIGFIISYVLAVSVLMSGLVPISILWAMQSCSIPIVVSGKLLQVAENYKNGSTGQLSAATMFSLTAGSLARIFTSIQETGDKLMIVMYVCTTTVNLLVSSQILYYWNADKKVKGHKETAKKKN